MLGLRKQESNKFEQFFSIVQDAAEKKGAIFFLDAGDGREFETAALEGEDLMGWLIPKERAPDFLREWTAGDISDDWTDFFQWAIWENAQSPSIHFSEDN